MYSLPTLSKTAMVIFFEKLLLVGSVSRWHLKEIIVCYRRQKWLIAFIRARNEFSTRKNKKERVWLIYFKNVLLMECAKPFFFFCSSLCLSCLLLEWWTITYPQWKFSNVCTQTKEAITLRRADLRKIQFLPKQARTGDEWKARRLWYASVIFVSTRITQFAHLVHALIYIHSRAP